MKHKSHEPDLSAALASAAKDYATKRTEENRRVMTDLLMHGYNEGAPLFIPYFPTEGQDGSQYATVKLKDKSFLLFFTHSEDALDTDFVSLLQTNVRTILNYLYDFRDEHGLSGIAFYTGKDSLPCFVTIHHCLDIAERYHSIDAAVQSRRFTAKLANLIHSGF